MIGSQSDKSLAQISRAVFTQIVSPSFSCLMGWCQRLASMGRLEAVDTLSAPAACGGREFAGHHRPTQRGAAGEKVVEVCCPFSRMRSKGSRFTLGVWGRAVFAGCCVYVSAIVHNRSQPFATVRNRPRREDHMAVSMVSSAKGVLF